MTVIISHPTFGCSYNGMKLSEISSVHLYQTVIILQIELNAENIQHNYAI